MLVGTGKQEDSEEVEDRFLSERAQLVQCKQLFTRSQKFGLQTEGYWEAATRKWGSTNLPMANLKAYVPSIPKQV